MKASEALCNSDTQRRVQVQALPMSGFWWGHRPCGAPAGSQLCRWGKCVREHPPCCPFPASGLSFESASPRMHRKELGAEVICRHDLGAFWLHGAGVARGRHCLLWALVAWTPIVKSLTVLASPPGMPALGVTAHHTSGL